MSGYPLDRKADCVDRIHSKPDDRAQHASQRNMLIAVSLAVLTLLVYWPVQGHDFLTWDDYEYVVENPHVRSGLSRHGVAWAFTTAHAGNWHPLTWISHMLDCDLYGLNAAGHHLNNLLLHLINTLLLFVLLVRMTHAHWQSSFVAAVFALHPLHVESVAWVSERKDLLSTFFFMLTCLAYLRYTASPALKRYFPCIVLFALGLASKPMLVTLPVVLLLLDYWPLCRTRFQWAGVCSDGSRSLIGLVWEKWPFFALASLSTLVTLFVAGTSPALAPLDTLPLGQRVGNAVVSYTIYLIKGFNPHDLAFFYPHPLGTLTAAKVIGASLFLACLSLTVFLLRRRCPWLLMGWLWYGVTLLPVIGLIQVGSQARADRYTYVPLIGIAIMVAWGAAHLVRRRGSGPVALGLAGAVILWFSLRSASELRHWRDGETLFRRALQVTEGNYTAHYQLGSVYMRQGNWESAVHHLSEAVRFRPDHFAAHHGLGLALLSQGLLDRSLQHLHVALQGEPRSADILSSIGDAYLAQGKWEQAISSYGEALEINPLLWRVHNNIGLAFLRNEMPKEAEIHFEEALRINPGALKARYNLQVLSEGKE